MRMFLLLIFLVSCKAQDLQKLTDPPKTQSALIKSKWHNFPITIELSNTRKTDTEDAVINSVKKWNDALGFEAIRYQYTNYDDSIYTLGASNKNRVYFVNNFNGYDGHAENKNFINTQSLEIYHADIVFDAEAYYNLEDVLTHQLGHVLGEQHNTYGIDQHSVMNSIVSEIYNSLLTSGDVQKIKDRYGMSF